MIYIEIDQSVHRRAFFFDFFLLYFSLVVSNCVDEKKQNSNGYRNSLVRFFFALFQIDFPSKSIGQVRVLLFIVNIQNGFFHE